MNFRHLAETVSTVNQTLDEAAPGAEYHDGNGYMGLAGPTGIIWGLDPGSREEYEYIHTPWACGFEEEAIG